MEQTIDHFEIFGEPLRSISTRNSGPPVDRHHPRRVVLLMKIIDLRYFSSLLSGAPTTGWNLLNYYENQINVIIIEENGRKRSPQIKFDLGGSSHELPTRLARCCFSHSLVPEIWAWISNHVRDLHWDEITHQCSSFNGSLNNPPLKMEIRE